MTEFTSDEYKIIQQAVRYYQINGKDYESCSSVLGKLFPLIYTQKLEQPT